ncbi:MAG: LPP20 family lipoprotein [Desulfosudaceae bacterium]
MKTKGIMAVMMLVLLAAPAWVGAQDRQGVVENMQNGQVNWSTGIIQATGIGAPPEQYMGKPQARPMALRAAKLDAYRNLLEVSQGVRVNSTTLVKNYAVENDVIMTRVEGLVKGAQAVDTEYMSDGTVEVTLRMSLNGDFAQVVLPRDIQDIEPLQPTPQPGETWQPQAPAETPDAPDDAVYTGLVVDAKGLNAKPAMAPKVLDEEGKEVYGSDFVSREYAIQQGMSGYAKQVEAAQANSRVTDNPLTVEGLKTVGPGKCDIVISNADASTLRSASENLSFLKKCRVMIVVD